jgi:hypothetical protein
MAASTGTMQPAGAATAGGAPAQAQAAAAPASVIPFLRGTGLGKYKFASLSGQTLTAAAQPLSTIDIKAYDYMESLLLEVVTTANGGATGTAQADAPFNLFSQIQVVQPNGQTMYNVSNGIHAAYIQKYGYSRAFSDPRSDPSYQVNGSIATFALRVPFLLDNRDALGVLPNKDAAAPFQLNLTYNTLSSVFGTGQGTSPTFTLNVWLEANDQPPTTLNGQPVQTTPPNMNTLQRWTEQNITISTGQFDARVRKLGNYLRMLIPVMRNSSGARIGGLSSQSTNWVADPMQIVLDEDVKDNISQNDWFRRIYEIWGYGGIQSGTAATLGTASSSGITFDSPLGLDTGVYPINYFNDRRGPDENANLYLPTIESEDYLLRGSYGSATYKMTMLVGEVLPQGNIFE